METGPSYQSAICVSNEKFFKCIFTHQFKNVVLQLESSNQEDDEDFEEYQKVAEQNKALLLYLSGKNKLNFTLLLQQLELFFLQP